MKHAAHPYSGQQVAFLTQHGKEAAVSPILESLTGCQVLRVTGFDTDQLGTFTREIPRLGSQLDAARRKARIGMELHKAHLGLASEGSFGPDPHTGLFPWNIEVLVFIDDLRQLEVVGIHQGPASIDHLLAREWSDLEAFARRVDFPRQHLVLRPCDENDARVRKGLADWPSLENAFAWAKGLGQGDTPVFVERDLRANGHPERMENIAKAAKNLAEKLVSFCPDCAAPGYCAIDRETGLRCAACGFPTQEMRHEIWACGGCGRREKRPRADGILLADPMHCSLCNP